MRKFFTIAMLLFSFNTIAQTNNQDTLFKKFWTNFQNAVKEDNKTQITEMTSTSFCNNDECEDSASFLNNYQTIIDFSDDEKFMIKNAKFGKEITAPKRQNESGIEYEYGSTISLKKITDKSSLKFYRKKFKLALTAKVYRLEYNCNVILEDSSHPNQTDFFIFYFGQTTNGYKFCGKGMIGD